MSKAFIKNHCSSCGKDLTSNKTVVVMADMSWIHEDSNSGLSRVKFKPGIDTRNAYCNVHCLNKDLQNQLMLLKDTSNFTLN